MLERLVKFRRGERQRYEEMEGEDGVLRSPNQVEIESLPPDTPCKGFPEGKINFVKVSYEIVATYHLATVGGSIAVDRKENFKLIIFL